jgi:TolB-like protein/class 3 adenylate cyclase
MSQSRQLAAIMFTDIVGYTALMGEDEEKAFELLEKNRLIQKPIIEKHNGRWLKEIGDGVLASFNTVSDAVYCAKAIQKACLQKDELKLRIGIHQGEVVFKGNDVFGDGVNIASRLEPLAPVGGILVSESVHRNLGNKKDIESTFVREEQLKNVKEPIRIYSIQAAGADPVIHGSSKNSQQASLRSWGPKKMAFTIAGVIIILLLSYFLYSRFSENNDPSEAQAVSLDKSIVVLPFTNLSSDPEQEYFSDGMMEEILNHLVKIEDLKVISRTTAMQYKTTAKPVSEITNELNVATALEGSVRKDGDQIRITVQLIDGGTDTHLWSESYDRQLTNIFEIQSDVAQQVAQVLKAQISPETKLKIESQPTTNTKAYNSYLLAEEQVKAGNYATAIDLYEEAISLDPEFANAYAELGHRKSHWLSEDLQSWNAAEAVRIAIPYYEKAFEIDRNNIIAHKRKAQMHFYYEWDFEAAEKEYQILKQLDSSADFPLLLRATGRYGELLESTQNSLTHDPLSLMAWGHHIQGLHFSNQPEKALQAIDETKKLYKIVHNKIGLYYLITTTAMVYSNLDMHEEVIETIEANLNESKRPYVLSNKAIAYFHLGMEDRSYDIIKEIESSHKSSVNPYFSLAMIYAQMGDIDAAFDWLEKAYINHEVYMYRINVEPYFIPLYNDPRWQQMLDKVGFPGNT